METQLAFDALCASVEDGQQILTVSVKHLWLLVCDLFYFLFISMPIKKLGECLHDLRCGCMAVVNTPVSFYSPT